MKKLIVLIAVIMALLFTGCCPTCPDTPVCPDCVCPECPDCVCPVVPGCPDIPECPECPECPTCPDCIYPDIPPEEEKIITITWFEDAIRYNPEDEETNSWFNDPLGPATLIQDNGGWYFADVNEAYNAAGDLIDFSGAVAISETGVFSGYTTYTSLYSGLPIEDNFLGQVEIIVYEDGTGGTMVGTYTQWAYAFGTKTEVTDGLEGFSGYPGAVECAEEGKWFIGHTDYITYPR